MKEALELFALWQEPKEEIELEVDLVAPVMRRISLLQRDRSVDRRSATGLRRIGAYALTSSHIAAEWRSSITHFGLSAGLALILFHFGVFEQIVPAATSLHAFVVGNLHGWLAYANAVM